MGQKEVEQIFYQKLHLLINPNLEKSQKPIVVLLGGQPASGKTSLDNLTRANNPDRSFLTINGDLYRVHHPDFRKLVSQPEKFSNQTQIFSNVFTEKLIEEALKHKYNTIIEGTMRNPAIPMRTANMFKNNGFNVECYVIAAPREITAINIYNRYQEEVSKTGKGRLAEMSSHNEAFKNIGASLDSLYKNNSVDKIHIYTLYGKEKVATLSLNNNNWDTKLPPSHFINLSRQKQLNNRYLLSETMTKGKNTLNKISDDLKPNLKKELEALQKKVDLIKKRGYEL